MRFLKNFVARKHIFMIIFLAACNASPMEPTLIPGKENPEWFAIPLTDVQTGDTFKINEFSGKVVLVETMAIWCPNCIIQAHEVQKLHEMLDEPGNLVSVSLDIDVHEEATELKKYVRKYGFDWHFAVAPLELARALGNLYGANYLNPPLSPMLVIDRNGDVHTLDHGKKTTEMLFESLSLYLTP